MYSTWLSPPALRTVSLTLSMCLPLAQCIIRFGDALSTYLVRDRSWTLTLPAPPPLPTCMLPDWDMPQLQFRTSISSLWALSMDSPLMSPILMKISTAMFSPCVVSTTLFG
ncbi:hypothetical protein D3C80_1932680 [compost metagenome]